ncbi:MAG: type II toxin-antitoxin system ParD family antitoxin [Acidobacteriia bacterium]|nr:type II toxin-antitoxin system ParD family antitoxin [Terriglobia bacterium]
MNITLRPDIQERIAEKVQKGEYENADALVQQALDWFLGVEDERELEETRSAVEEARAQSARGEAVAAEEVFQELRARYGISR